MVHAPPLWPFPDLCAATYGLGTTPPSREITGVCIDTRTLSPGDLFIPLVGENGDGHAFLAQAFEKGASCALSALPPPKEMGPLVMVADTRNALENMGLFKRRKTSAQVIAVTGSVGKTSTKEMFAHTFSALGRTHASTASYNNHWGVPLSLARLPGDVQFGIFELGMNHAGEIKTLVGMVEPHIAVITAIAEGHIGHFKTLSDIARAKAEIFTRLSPLEKGSGGGALLPRDTPYFELLKEEAHRHSATHLCSFGAHPASDIRLLSYHSTGSHGMVEASVFGRHVSYALGVLGRHMAINSLAVLGAATLLGLNLDPILGAFLTLPPLAGRGMRHHIPIKGGHFCLIDDSYNANPTSMEAAFLTLAHTPVGEAGRRIALLGDMLELGSQAEALHHRLAQSLALLPIHRVYTCGTLMRTLSRALPETQRGAHTETLENLAQELHKTLRPGDVVLVKGSSKSRMHTLVGALQKNAIS